MPPIPKTQHPQLRPWLRLTRIDSITRIPVTQLQTALDWASSESRESHDALATYLLSRCIESVFGKDDSVQAESLLIYLLETTNADLAAATRGRASIEMYEWFSAYTHELIHLHGQNKNQRLLDMARINELIVEKLLELDATVDHDFPEPVLETCARVGSLALFKLLRDRGAQMTKRLLHKAAQGAASVGADPSMTDRALTFRRLQDRVDVLRYLLEDYETDINELDDEIGDPVGRFGYWGTPLSYAASEARGAKVVNWMLDRGADPRKGKNGGKFDAIWAARFQGNFEVLIELSSTTANREISMCPMMARSQEGHQSPHIA
ncbi:hypothetical protein E8E12_002382 [Didymella heteroderae]|uniref:Uncharacterized protein n=1 Tax=Didymella heteroderae TaxID=1769908 RepID=A0A9P4WUH7_9PLEO|nr:hypothetical protein E8E12_002382 [Didymella heteroderae]